MRSQGDDTNTGGSSSTAQSTHLTRDLTTSGGHNAGSVALSPLVQTAVVISVLAATGSVVNWFHPQQIYKKFDLKHNSEASEAAVSYDAMSFTFQRPSVILFGDSITERGHANGWVAGLAHYYQRRADVVNRGFGGYNSRWALNVVDHVFASSNAKNTVLATLFFGANDAARPTGPSNKQHVPVREYQDNMSKLVKAIRSKGIKRILLISPPPVHDEGRKAWQVVKVGSEVAAGLEHDRTLEYTKQYAEACVAAGEKEGLPVVDLYNLMQDKQGWGQIYFNDGLHLTSEGNDAVLGHVLRALEQHFPDVRPETLPIHLPPWDSIDETDPDRIFKESTTLRNEYGTVPLKNATEPDEAPLDSNQA